MQTFQLSSPAFLDEHRIPQHHHTCDGADLPPPLSWAQPPAGTTALVLALEDPDSTATPRVHWLCRGMPPRAGALDADPPLVMGTNSFSERSYRGPCPPHGDGPHRFVCRLYALNAELPVLGRRRPSSDRGSHAPPGDRHRRAGRHLRALVA